MIDEDDYIYLSSIEAYLFCKKQWILRYVEGEVGNNDKLTEGKILHERADSGKDEIRGDIIICRSLPIKSRILQCYGISDVVEFHRSDKGSRLFKREGLWQPIPIEYKLSGINNISEAEKYQLCAQGICLEEMFCVSIEYGFIFDSKTRRRIKVIFDQQTRDIVQRCFSEMYSYLKNPRPYRANEKKSCRNCSLYSACMPSLSQKRSVEEYMLMWGDSE